MFASQVTFAGITLNKGNTVIIEIYNGGLLIEMEDNIVRNIVIFYSLGCKNDKLSYDQFRAFHY